MFYFKKQVPVGSTPVPAAATVAVPAPVVHQTPDSTDVLPENHAVATESPNPELNANPNFHAIPRRSRPFPTRRDVQPEINNEQTGVETAVGSPVAAPVVVQVKPEPRSSVASDTKQRTAPLGSQLISPKTPQTKGKVIQWP